MLVRFGCSLLVLTACAGTQKETAPATCAKPRPLAGAIVCPTGTEVVVRGYVAEHAEEPQSMERRGVNVPWRRRTDPSIAPRTCAGESLDATSACMGGFESRLSAVRRAEVVATWSCRKPDGVFHGPFLKVLGLDTIKPGAQASSAGIYRDGVLDGPVLVWELGRCRMVAGE